jgi:hypothetical protein
MVILENTSRIQDTMPAAHRSNLDRFFMPGMGDADVRVTHIDANYVVLTMAVPTKYGKQWTHTHLDCKGVLGVQVESHSCAEAFHDVQDRCDCFQCMHRGHCYHIDAAKVAESMAARYMQVLRERARYARWEAVYPHWEEGEAA